MSDTRDIRTELRGQLLYQVYGELRAQITPHVLMPQYVNLDHATRELLLQEAADHLESRALPLDFFTAHFAVGEKSAFRAFYANLNCHSPTDVQALFQRRMREISQQLRYLTGLLSALPIPPETKEQESSLCRLLDQLYWPLVFVRPPSEGSAYTWPATIEFIQEVMHNFGVSKTYLPTVFGGPTTSLGDLSEFGKTAFHVAHKVGKFGHFQTVDPTDITAGVPAFDDRIIADYELTTGDFESATYDWLLGAVSGVQVQLDALGEQGQATALLVLCSAVKSFFHALAFGSDANIRGDLVIASPARRAQHSETIMRPRRWDDDARRTRVTFVDSANSSECTLFTTLRAAADKSTATRTGKLLAQLTAEELKRDRARAATAQPICDVKPAPSSDEIPELIGDSLHDLKRLIVSFAKAPVTVLVRGESGTGKELVAQAIHKHCERHDKPLISVNCGALAETLIESELFGHARGAFTGAVESKRGYFEAADGGVLFLDEIGEMSAQAQTKFLRVLEDGTFTPVGGTNEIKVDVRIVAATNADLAAAIQNGRFREDLYFRIQAGEVVLPPLRERAEDIPMLADHFLNHYLAAQNKHEAKWNASALNMLKMYSWPGNVRELRNSVERAVSAWNGHGSEIGPELLPNAVRVPAAAPSGRHTTLTTPQGGATFGDLEETDRLDFEAKVAHQNHLFAGLDAQVRNNPTLWRQVIQNRLDDADDRFRHADLLDINEAMRFLNKLDFPRSLKTLKTAVQNQALHCFQNPAPAKNQSPKRFFFKDLHIYADEIKALNQRRSSGRKPTKRANSPHGNLVEKHAEQLGTRIVCSQCGNESPGVFSLYCQHDSKLMTPKYSQMAVTQLPQRGSFGERFERILPSRVRSCRESETLSSQLIDGSKIGAASGIRHLWLKDETTLPTGTTKSRMAAVALAYLSDCGVKRFVVSSTGNSTAAMSRLMEQYPEMRMIAFAGQRFAARHDWQEVANVEKRFIDGDFVDAERAAKEYASELGITWEGGFFNPARRVGLVTAYVEACSQLGQHPHWYFQAVSSGMGVVAVGEFAECQRVHGQITAVPRLVAVQQESCAPMVNAFGEKCERIEPQHRVHNPNGIAEAILRGDPSASYPHVREHVIASDGDIVSVTEAEIRAAQTQVQRHFEISVGGSAAAAVAAAQKLGQMGKISADEIVLVNLSGRQ